jgi:ankyrin repeat protein
MILGKKNFLFLGIILATSSCFGATQSKAPSFGGKRLRIAIARGDYDKVKDLLDRGVSAETLDVAGNIPLIFAVQAGHTKITEPLLERGANVNTAGLLGTTPLMYAAYQGDIDMVRLLLKKGAGVNVKGSWPAATALELAMRGLRFSLLPSPSTQKRYIEVIKLLEEAENKK